MPTLYRIKYKFMENGKTYEGVRVVEVPVREYIENVVHKNYRDATLIFVELMEEFEKPPELSVSDQESVIIISP